MAKLFFPALVTLSGAGCFSRFVMTGTYIHHGPVRCLLPRFVNRATAEKFAHTKESTLLLRDWQRIDIPVTVVQGDSYRIVDPSNLDFARRQLQHKQAEFIVLPGAGHLIRWRNAGVVRKILLSQAVMANVR